MYVDRTRTYIGIVEDNEDPKKIGRCKVRVIDIFDDIPVEDIPWASPWKDLNGNQFIPPDKGKMLTVIFDSGNIYKPEYIYADHYNINLEKKLKSLSGKNYTSMRALLFDHKTQIYSNDEEGLKIDYKFNNINITDNTIDLNLKDNYQKINLGDSAGDQQTILGTNFLEWFDEFVDNLLGNKSGPYLGNLGAPVVANPEFITVLQKYKAKKYPKFLSKNVWANDNSAIQTVRQKTDADKNLRINDGQIGDNIRSTVKNNLHPFTREPNNFEPIYGNGEETPMVPEPLGGPDAFDDNASLSTGDGQSISDPASAALPEGNPHPDILKIISAMEKKGYKVEKSPLYLNIVGIRYQYEGQEYSNNFKDRLWAIWMNENRQWESQNWAVSTIPGLYKNFKTKLTMKKWASTNRKEGIAILVPAQYLNIFKFEEAQRPESEISMKSRPFFKSVGIQRAYRDRHFDDNKIYFDNKESIDTRNLGIYIHRGYPGGLLVNNWSEGCTVFSRENDYKNLCSLARLHNNKHGNNFHYTLMMGSDIE